MSQGKDQKYTERQKEFILRALTDPKFRKELESDPARALGRDSVTPEMLTEIGLILASVAGIESMITAMADKLLCADGGPCGIG